MPGPLNRSEQWGAWSISFTAPQPVLQSGAWTVGLANGTTVNANVTFPDTQKVAGTVSVGNFPASQAVTGTFWQATQPISAASLPLPAGAATASGVAAIVTALGSPLQAGGAVTNSPAPGSTAANALVPSVYRGVSSAVVKASPGNLFSASAVAATTDGACYLIALNRTTAPAANATITAAETMAVVPIGAGAGGSITPNDFPDRFTTGIVLIVSTSTATFTPPVALPLHIRVRFI